MLTSLLWCLVLSKTAKCPFVQLSSTIGILLSPSPKLEGNVGELSLCEADALVVVDSVTVLVDASLLPVPDSTVEVSDGRLPTFNSSSNTWPDQKVLLKLLNQERLLTTYFTIYHTMLSFKRTTPLQNSGLYRRVAFYGHGQ